MKPSGIVAEQPTCWMCMEMHYGHSVVQYAGRQFKLDPHHIVNRRGVRFDDWRNLAVLCRMCHDRAHGQTVIWESERYSPIRQDTVLWLKSQYDPDRYDRQFLATLATGSLPRARWHNAA